MVAVIDSGVDYFHPDFRNEDGTTRIRHFGIRQSQNQKEMMEWRQMSISEGENRSEEGTEDTGKSKKEPAKKSGVKYTKEQINEVLAAGSREEDIASFHPDLSGHGNGSTARSRKWSASGGQYRGVASKSDILVVKIGTAGSEFAEP